MVRVHSDCALSYITQPEDTEIIEIIEGGTYVRSSEQACGPQRRAFSLALLGLRRIRIER